MTHGDIISIFWNEKFLKSVNSDHFRLINDSDTLKHETFSVVITWLENYLDDGFDDNAKARNALCRRLNNEVGLVLTNDELDNIMK